MPGRVCRSDFIVRRNIGHCAAAAIQESPYRVDSKESAVVSVVLRYRQIAEDRGSAKEVLSPHREERWTTLREINFC
jgi:hypothetical protein